MAYLSIHRLSVAGERVSLLAVILQATRKAGGYPVAGAGPVVRAAGAARG